VLVLLMFQGILVCIKLVVILRIYIESTSGIRMPICVWERGKHIRKLESLCGIKERNIIYQDMEDG